MAKKVLYHGDLLKTDDWGKQIIKDGITYYAAAGDAVQNFIKGTFEEKVGYIIVPEGKEKYYCFADKTNYELWVSDPETYQDLIIATFDAPAQYKATITLTTPLVNDILYGTTGNYIKYTFDVKTNDTTGTSTGEDVYVKYTFTNSGSTQTVTESYTYGTNVEFNVDNYLRSGTNVINIDLTSKKTETTTSVAVTYNVVAFTLSSTFDISKPITGNTLDVYFTMSGSGTKTIEWNIDGNKLAHSTEDDITDNTGSRTKYIDISTLSDGLHRLQYKGYITVNNKKYYSQLFYREFVVKRTSESLNGIMISLDYDRDTDFITSFDSISINGIEQYSPYTLTFAAYHSNASEQQYYNVIVYINDVAQGSQDTENNKVYTFTFTPAQYGETTIKLNNRTFNTSISKTTKDISEITDGLKLALRAQGKSNSSSDRDSWTYGDITTTFTGFDWTTENGWDADNNRLVIGSGASINVNYQPLATDSKKTIEIEFGTKDITNDDAVICDMTTNGVGLKITASEVQLISAIDAKSSNITISTRFKSDKTYRTGIVIYPKSGVANKCLVMLYIDGKICGVTNFDSTDNFVSAKNIIIGGSDNAKVIVKDIRCYDETLTHDQILNNYMLYRDTVKELNDIYDRNNIYNSDKSGFSTDILSNQLPVLIFTGDIPTFETYTSKKTPIIVDMEYINMQDKTKSFKWYNVYMTPQGTSSMSYPIKNLRPYTQKSDDTICYDWEGNKLTGKNRVYAFKSAAGTQKDSQAVKCWTIKADFAESSGTHNTGVARLWNQCMTDAKDGNTYILRTAAQKAASENEYNYDVRTTVDGFPIVCFYRLTSSSPLVYMGKYNFNNDKSSESVFGFKSIPGFNKGLIDIDEKDNGFYQYARTSDEETLDSMKSRFEAEIEAGTLPASATTYLLRANRTDGYDSIIYVKEDGVWTESEIGLNPMECWEILTSGSDYSLYKTTEGWYVKDEEGTAAWEEAFEARYPDVGSEQDTINLKRLCDWLVSTRILDTDTTEQAKVKLIKFRDELSSHFEVDRLLAYYIYLMRFGAVDQTTKNAMLTSDDGQKWYFINYDNDTILGVRNDGLLKYGPRIDRQSYDSQINDYCYAGHDSTLWNNLERVLGYLDDDKYSDIVSSTLKNRIVTVDNALSTAGLTYSKTIEMFNEKQSESWCERVCNQDAQFKYISTYTDSLGVTNFLSSLQGSRTAHREWWLSNRFDLYDSKWVSGDYRNKYFEWKAGDAENTSFTITAGDDLYYAYGLNSEIAESKYLSTNTTHIFTISQKLQIGSPARIYAAPHVKKIDLSAFAKYISFINVEGVYSSNSGTKLEELILGKDNENNNSLVSTSFTGLSAATQLKKLNIKNYKSLTTINTSEPKNDFKNLEELYAQGSGLLALTLVNSNIKNMYLPAIETLSLEGCNKMNILSFDDITKLKTLTVSNCNYDFQSMVEGTDIPDTTTINMSDINWNMTDADTLIALKTRRGDYLNITGKIYLQTQLTSEDIVNLKAKFGDNCFSPEAPLYITAKDTIILNKPADGYEGETYQFTLSNLTGKEGVITYTISGGTDKDSIDNNGLLVTGYKSTDRTITVTANFKSTDGTCDVSDSKNINIEGKTYPEILEINGETSIDQEGEEIYLINLVGYTGEIESSTWSINTGGSSEISEYVELSKTELTYAIINVKKIPVTTGTKTFTLHCESTFDNGSIITGDLSIDINPYTYPTEISKISGRKRINKSEGEEQSYQPVFDIDSFTGPVSYLWTLGGETAGTSIKTGATEKICTLSFTDVTDVKKTVTLTCTVTRTKYPTELKELTKTLEITVQHEEYILSDTKNKKVFDVCKRAWDERWPASTEGIYASELEDITTIDTYFSYSLRKNWYKGSSQGGYTGDLDYPDTFNEFQYFTSVTLINQAFYNDSSTLQSVILPLQLKTIDSGSFQGCFGLKSIMNNSVSDTYDIETIGSNAFFYCHDLTDFNFTRLPKLVSIGSTAFSNCYGIKTIDLSGCPSLETISSGAFRIDYSGRGSQENINLTGTKLTRIEDSTFYTSVTDTLDTTGITMKVGNKIEYCGSKSLINRYINEIYFYGTTAPNIEEDTFSTTKTCKVVGTVDDESTLKAKTHVSKGDTYIVRTDNSVWTCKKSIVTASADAWEKRIDNINYKGSVSAYKDLPTTEISIDDVYLVTQESKLYKCISLSESTPWEAIVLEYTIFIGDLYVDSTGEAKKYLRIPSGATGYDTPSWTKVFNEENNWEISPIE